MILVDFSPIILASAFMSGEKEVNVDLLRHMTLSSILNFKKKFSKYGNMVIAFDGKNYWRKEIHPGYKGHRAANKAKSKFDWQGFYPAMDQIKKEFPEVFPYRFIEIEGCEADDIIGHLALNAREDTVIVSPDGDFKQCLRNPYVKHWSNVKKAFTPNETLYDVELALHKKIMKGDSGDNINNVLTPLDYDGRQRPVTQRFIDQVFEQGIGETLMPRYKENQKLIDLREIPDNLQRHIEASMEWPIRGSKGKIWNYLASKELQRIGSFLKDAEDFV